MPHLHIHVELSPASQARDPLSRLCEAFGKRMAAMSNSQ
jgi:hypothetical protein